MKVHKYLLQLSLLTIQPLWCPLNPSEWGLPYDLRLTVEEDCYIKNLTEEFVKKTSGVHLGEIVPKFRIIVDGSHLTNPEQILQYKVHKGQVVEFVPDNEFLILMSASNECAIFIFGRLTELQQEHGDPIGIFNPDHNKSGIGLQNFVHFLENPSYRLECMNYIDCIKGFRRSNGNAKPICLMKKIGTR